MDGTLYVHDRAFHKIYEGHINRLCRSYILQIIKFSVCYFNVDCDRTYLDYYDGNIRNEHYRYCGLRNLLIPPSKANVAILEHYDDIIHNGNDIVIHYTSTLAELADSGKRRRNCTTFQAQNKHVFIISFIQLPIGKILGWSGVDLINNEVSNGS